MSNKKRWQMRFDDLSIIYSIDATNEAEIVPGNFNDEYEKTKKLFYIKNN